MRKYFYLLLVSLFFVSCANVVVPDGGGKDVVSPKIIQIMPADRTSKFNNSTIHFLFDEYIESNNWNENFYISPPVEKGVKKQIKNKELILYLIDTLKNNTYVFSLNNCIKDLNEGNVVSELAYLLSTSENLDTLKITGILEDAYTLDPIENAWIILYDINLSDSLIFKSSPAYISKTNKAGLFNFPNLKRGNYNVFALTGLNFQYEKGERIAFLSKMIAPEKDSFLVLKLFDPIQIIDSTKEDSLIFNTDTLSTNRDKILSIPNGSLLVNLDTGACLIFQLLQNKEVIHEYSFSNMPYTMNNITPGKYLLKCIVDDNCDKNWTTGDIKLKLQPEKVITYKEKITIRSNWDLELTWDLE